MQENDSTNDEKEETDCSSSEEEIEPKFKYVRIANDLEQILKKEVVTCTQINSKFLLFGTYFGAVYLLDHQGNKVESSLHQERKYCHTVAVNRISTDAKEEHVASCSDDGHAIITGLFSDSNNLNLDVGKPVKSIALDPDPKSALVKRFIIGDDCLTLYEKTFFKSLNSTILSRAEGCVTAIAWKGQFVAWASHTGVRVYDLNDRCSLGLMSWEVPPNGELKNFRCNLRWTDATTLLVGWVDTVRVCKIRKRSSIEIIAKGLPNFVVDPVSTFQTTFFVCGLAPLTGNQLVVLGYPKEKDPETQKAQRPVLCVLEYKGNDYEEVCTDCLSLRGYQEYKVNHYNLEYILEEHRYFIVAPKDIVVATLYEADDRVQWLLEHGKFEEAMDVISTHGGHQKNTLTTVARLNVDDLLKKGKYDEAAKLCLRVLGNNKNLWEEEVYKFLQYNQLRSVSAYLPRTDECKLNPQVYEMVLFECLKMDAKGLIELLKEWPPSLYNTSAVINAILKNFDPKESEILLESLAILYTHEKKYDKALEMYLKLQNKDVFDLIRNRDLYDVIHKQIIALIQLDREKAINLLTEKNKIHPEVVVKQLEKKDEYLYWYLDALNKVDNRGLFDHKLVNLYVKFEPKKLLSFLKRSNNYPIEIALETCQKIGFHEETVYLMGRAGNTLDALKIIINDINDIEMAIDFCKEHNHPDLWNQLIDESLKRPEIMTQMLDGIVGYVDPESLINKIPVGQEIPGLKKSLIKMLCDFRLQVSIQDSCNNIMMTDYFNVQDSLVKTQNKGTMVGSGSCCAICRKDIVQSNFNGKSSILVFNCRHIFHEKCILTTADEAECCICAVTAKGAF